MNMHKTGNQHSSLLDSLVKSAEKAKEKATAPNPELAEKIMESLKTKQAQPSLREVLASVNRRVVANGLSKTAQFEDPALTEPAPPAAEPLGDEMGGDMGVECDPEIKNKLKDAFIAACGGVEQAHACLDEGSGDELTEELPDEGAELGMEVEEPEMPAPMPMPGGEGPPIV
jgi:hypothetical protein